MFRILHLSDLHIRRKTEWSTRPILKDAKRAILEESKLENFNVVVFTGDIAFGGQEEEYDEAFTWLEDLCLTPSGLNLDARNIMFVPGNHDVDRSSITSSTTAIEEALKRATTEDDVARYYSEDCVSNLVQRHRNYFKFCHRFGNPDLAFQCWSRLFDAAGLRIRFDGLNSSWLCRGDDDHRRLLIGQPQLTDLLSKQEECDLCVTLFHHPTSDLMEFDERNAVNYLRNESDIVLRGHMHNADSMHINSQNGSYLEIAAGALFEGHESPNRFNIIDIEEGTCEVFVKTLTWSRAKWIIDRNLADNSEGQTRFTLDSANIGKFKQFSSDSNARPVLIDKYEPESASSRSKFKFVSVESFPRWARKPERRDMVVRGSEIAATIEQLESKRIALIRKEAGAKADGFLAAMFNEYCTDPNVPILHLPCAGIASGEDLQSLLALSANHTITELGAELKEFGKCILVLDNLDQVQEPQGAETASTIETTIGALLDFCDDLLIVRTSFSSFGENAGEIKIGALDLADTRAYLEASSVPINSYVDYSRINRVTGGLPVHLDSIISSLSVSGLEEALAQIDAVPVVAINELPRSVVDALTTLQSSNERDEIRSRSLLQILSILDRGETLATVKRVDPSRPIWPQHATYLLNKDCLDVIDTAFSYYENRYSMYPSANDKILRVPRLVRDFAISQMTSEQKSDLTKKIASVYFADDWRNGSVRMRRRIAFGNAISTHQSGNEMTIFRLLSQEPLVYFQEYEKFYALGLSYISQLKSKGFYGEAYEAAREFLGFASTADVQPDVNSLTHLRSLAAQSARMIGEREACIEFINDALPQLRSSGDKAHLSDALVTLALTLESLQKLTEAEATAKEIISITERESPNWFQAKAILVKLDSDTSKRRRALRQLGTRARNLKHHTVADNIVLEIVADSDDTEEKLKLLGSIKSRGEREYNYVRATIRRVETLLESGRQSELTKTDETDLWRSYNLAYTQRLSGIFDWCHRVCWQVLIQTNQRHRLGDLLTYSSFAWRLNGKFDLEQEYLRKFNQIRSDSRNVSALGKIAQYIRKRLSMLVDSTH